MYINIFVYVHVCVKRTRIHTVLYQTQEFTDVIVLSIFYIAKTIRG